MQTIDVTPGASLETLEADVKAGLHTVKQGAIQMKKALAEIRSRRLWATVLDAYDNPVYPTFTAYLKIRWGLSESYGHELAAAGEVIAELADSGMPESDIPQDVTILNELRKVGPDDRTEVLEVAKDLGGGNPKRQSIQQARHIVRPESGQQYEVVEPSNPHHGEIITANEISGSIVVDLENEYPFLPAELKPVKPTPRATTFQQPATAPHRTEPADPLKTCQGLLNECLEYELPGELKARIHEALEL